MAKDAQTMPAVAAGRAKFELNAPAPGQAPQLAQQFVAGHGRWMAIDQNGVKTAPPAGRDGHRD